MFQTFSSYRADDAFHVSTLPGRSSSAKDFPDIHDLNLFAKLRSVNAITIPQQVSWRRIERKSFEHSLCSPVAGCTKHQRRREYEFASHRSPGRPKTASEIAALVVRMG